MRMSKPNIFRLLCVFLYILVLIHWNACFYFFVSYLIGFGSTRWVYGYANIQSLPHGTLDTLARRYLYSFYWSTLMLTTIGEVPWPVKSVEFVIVCADLLFGVLIFATTVGNVGSLITSAGATRLDLQTSIDNVKNYLKLRFVGKKLVHRIGKWFDYLWENKQAMGGRGDQDVLKLLPTKLQAEIAMHVHFETLRKVRLFQHCEAGLLGELVLKLELQVFSPRDYVCRKGDIGREMYIVKKGRLQVVADDGVSVLHTLLEGAVFGELSLLNIPGNKHGNRRSASIRSVGYTDLFVLKKADLWAALCEYPDAKKLLMQKGCEMLLKDGLLDATSAQNLHDESKSEEQQMQNLRIHVERLQHRLARLTAEYVSTEVRLFARLAHLERELAKYGINNE
uniref:Cyclic nucleotide-binding domain-containing protein n=1 Tax=Globodera rostochiensis TaxID=31243 RepID=A0A914GVV6_GLORO